MSAPGDSVVFSDEVVYGPPVDSGEVVRYRVFGPVLWPPTTRGRPSNATRATRVAERLAAFVEDKAVA